jgi:hypothetical protein
MDAVMTEAPLSPEAMHPRSRRAREVEPLDLGVVFEAHAAPMFRTILAYTGGRADMAASQVAFGEPTGVVRVSEGETFIRARVSGIRSTDRLVSPVGVDGDDGWDGVWTVEREGKTVASINYPALDGITCRFNAIGTA